MSLPVSNEYLALAFANGRRSPTAISENPLFQHPIGDLILLTGRL
jgi:hypothetical protein